MLRSPTISLALLLILPQFAALAGDDEKKDLEKLQGKWVAVEWELMSKSLDETEVREKNYVIEIKGDKAKIALEDGFQEAEIVLGADKDPKQIKLGKIFAIYQVRGDALRLCMGTTYPEEFRTKKGSLVQHKMITLRRAESIPPVDPEVEKVRAELIALEKKLAVESKKGSKFLKDAIINETIMVESDGRLFFGRELLDDLEDEPLFAFQFEGFRVAKISKDAFAVIYKQRSKAKDEKAFSERSTVSSIWTRRDGRWVNIYSHFSPLEEPDEADKK